MSITDELREWANELICHPTMLTRLTAIADRIDAEHDKACNDAWENGYEADYLGIEKWLTEHPQVMEHHGWVRLPVDADGVPIHVGDVMENIVCPSVHREVTGVGVECFYGWDEGNGRYSQFDVVCYRHHHAPTVEDVILDAISRCVGHSPEYWDKPIAECAAKLRLAESE